MFDKMRCCVKGCDSRGDRNTDFIGFHKFPKVTNTMLRADILSAWKDAVKVDKATAAMRVCSLHFTDSDYSHTKERRRLKMTAVPSLRLPDNDGSYNPRMRSTEPPAPRAEPKSRKPKEQMTMIEAAPLPPARLPYVMPPVAQTAPVDMRSEIINSRRPPPHQMVYPPDMGAFMAGVEYDSRRDAHAAHAAHAQMAQMAQMNLSRIPDEFKCKLINPSAIMAEAERERNNAAAAAAATTSSRTNQNFSEIIWI